MEILIIIVLILINFFFALSEAAFISSKKMRIHEECKKGKKNAKKVLDFMKEPEKFLSSVQVGITLIGVISGAFGGLAIAGDLNRLLEKIPPISQYSKDISIVVVVGLITYLSIVIGELFPKTIALRNPEKIILFVVPVMHVFAKMFYPVVIFLSFSTRMLLKAFNIKQLDDGKDNTIKDIVALTRLAVTNKKMNKDQEKILYNAINISKIKLHDIMIRRDNVKFLKTDMTLMDAMIESHIHHHTRYPLLDHVTDEVTGYINLKDIFSALQINPQFESIRSISRSILMFKESDKVIDVLPVLMKKAQHIAVVTNPENAMTGVITFEDIIESIIGDMNDEYDLLPEHIFRITESRFIVGGGVKMNKLRKDLDLDLPDIEDDISGWLIRTGGQLTPEKRIKYGSYEFIVRKIRKDKINELILQK
jgi:putative hemolysin